MGRQPAVALDQLYADRVLHHRKDLVGVGRCRSENHLSVANVGKALTADGYDLALRLVEAVLAGRHYWVREDVGHVYTVVAA